ncbi:MAG: hypothetical protein LIO77_11090 [Rikenellaceae bacterium]|nr:hypothetical protein [Rikenellaceae bacterium]
MKKLTIIFAALSIMAAVPHGETSAQKFLKKVSNAVDKATKKVDQVLGTESSPSGSKAKGFATTRDDGVVITSFSKDVNIELLSCVRDGNHVVLEFTLTNNGGEVLTMDRFGRYKTVYTPDCFTQVFDNVGNSYDLYAISLGKESTFKDTNTSILIRSVTVPSGVTLRGAIEIKPFDPSATKFTVVNIGATIDNDVVPVEFSFRNVTIRDFEDIQAEAVQLEKKVDPMTTGLADGFKVTAVTVTDRNTRVDMSFTNSGRSDVSLWMEEPTNNFIGYQGKKYRLLSFAQIGRRWADISVPAGKVHNYTLIFEPIPAGASTFRLHRDGGLYGDVFIEDPQGLNIPKISGAMTIDNSFPESLKRITDQERKDLKINDIKCDGFKYTWMNMQLAKGKTFYEGPEGKLQSIVFIEPDHACAEFLASYDGSGKLIDCIQIASSHSYGGDRGEGTVENNSVLATFQSPYGSKYVQYRILPDLKFQKVKEWADEDY